MSQTEIKQDMLDPIIRKNYQWLKSSPESIKTNDDVMRGVGAAFMSLVDYNQEAGEPLEPGTDGMLYYAKAAAKVLADILPEKTSMDWEEILLREADNI
jgi:hypothetical protein